MATLLKKPNNNKGVIIFTHKEWGFFSGNKLMRKLKREGKIPPAFYKELRAPYDKLITKLKRNYFIGIHFGCYYPHNFASNQIDFVLSGTSNIPNIDNSLSRIPLNSREFISKSFENTNIQKHYDIIKVAQNVKVKNWPLVFSATKKCLSQRPETTFLFITPSQSGVKHGIEKNLSDLFYRTFSQREQSQISFLFLHPTLEWGVNQKSLIRFYNQSRVFTLFSKAEGESRVVSEALCCGLPVVAYSKLKGGGTDLLNPENSVLFDEFESAHLSWIQALEKFPDGIVDKPELKTREDYSLPKLHRYFEELYSRNGMNYDHSLINTDHLDRRIPGHHYDVPWMIKGKPTADILSKKQFQIFTEHL